VSIKDGGFYTWDIVENVFWADRRYSEIVGMDHSLVDSGLPAEAFLDTVHDDDRLTVINGMKSAILDRSPFQHAYRIKRFNRLVEIFDYAQCIKSVDGCATLFTGIIFEAGSVAGQRFASNMNSIASKGFINR
jgi:hypothetical protein